MKEYEIWIGYVPALQGAEGLFDQNPRMIGKETAISFKVACFKHELKRVLKSVEDQETTKDAVDSQSMEWFYRPHNNSNSWLGRYFETSKEAEATFVKNQRQ